MGAGLSMAKSISVVAFLGLAIGLLLIYLLQRLDPAAHLEAGTIAVTMAAGLAVASGLAWVWHRLLPNKPKNEESDHEG